MFTILRSSHVRIDNSKLLPPNDKTAFVEAAKLAGEASRQFAANAEEKGVAELAQSGMQVVRSVDRAKFAEAISSAQPEFAQRFGETLIKQIQETSNDATP